MKLLKEMAFMLIVALGVLSFTACNEIENEHPTYDYATLVGDATSGYTFLLDSGIEADFTGSYDAASLKGLRRLYVYFSYVDDDLKVTSTKTTLKGKLLQVWKIEVDDMITREEATKAGALESDSIHGFSLDNFWCWNGFMNVVYSTSYSGKTVPTATIYYEPHELTNDSLILHMVVNRHVKETSTTGGFFSCYSLSPFAERYADKDSIGFRFTDGQKALTGKMATKILQDPAEVY